MVFQDELASVLPPDLPHREELIVKASAHLDLIVEANRQFNLTRIVSPREAAIKHVLDSVIPWRLFREAKYVLDAGSGAGFPGIPLALVLPEVRFTLSESIQKKARFLDMAVHALELTNVRVEPQRAEDFLRKGRADLITARAVAPITRAVGLFAPALRYSTRCLLYKGPDAEAEIAEAALEARKHKVRLQILERYDLPSAMGTRTIVEMA